MKDSKFLELLNLYLDHEISAADAALLEAEIQASPQRRRLYTQYCQIQKACTVLTHDFRSQAPAVPSTNVVQFPRRQSTARVVAYAGTFLAAAACIALVFVSRSRLDQNVSIPNASPGTSQMVHFAPSLANATLAKGQTLARPALQTVFSGLVNENPANETKFAAEGRAQLEWMNSVQFQRVPLEELRFDNRPELQSDGRASRSRRLLQQQVEMTAFRFQR